MSDAPAGPRWRVIFTPRWISWHLFALATVIGMIWLGDWQLRRALGGNILSWAYTFEWPVFAVFGVVFWVKTVRDELRPAAADSGPIEQVKVPAGARRARPAGQAPGAEPGDACSGDDDPADGTPEDVELAEYNAYLARLSREARGHGKWHGLR